MELETEITPASAGPQKARRPRGLVDARLIATLDQAERYATIAQRPEVAPALVARELPARFAVALSADIVSCRGHLAACVQSTTDRQVQTDKERTDRGSLIVLLQGAQNGARRKWARKPGERDKLKGYFVGTTLKTLGFAELSEAADTILRQARTDGLPGVSGDDLDALSAAIALWKATNEAQAQAQNAATSARSAAEALSRSILDRRIELQLAADRAFPHTDSANAAIRKEFGLPKNGPYSSV